jgi:glycine/D-amino acid oxidase-like deaminating enzyme
MKALTTWSEDVAFEQFSHLDTSLETEVCIIGAGLTGLLAAYFLAKDGRRIVVLEKGRIASGATTRTTGFLTQALDTDLSDLRLMLGQENAKRVIRSHGDAISLMEKIIQDENIECEFMRTSDYLYAATPADIQGLEKELVAAKALGVYAELVTAGRFPFPTSGALEFKHQAKFHPLKFMAGLVIVLKRMGVRIFENTEAGQIDDIASPFTVHTGPHTVSAEWIISATYSPFHEPAGLYLKKATYISYVLELSVPTGSLPEAMFEDQENPYHYFRVDRAQGHDRLIIGGEDHRADIPASRSKSFQALEDFARRTFPSLTYTIVRHWSGHVLEPLDGLALIGAYGHPNVLYASGFSGSGMTYAPIAASIFRDIIAGKNDELQKIYAPGRLPGFTSLALKSRDYALELMHGVVKNAVTYREK